MSFPIWIAVGDDFDCDDDAQRMAAFACAINGFDLPRFDLWASALPDCGLRLEMLERRAWAIEALMANNHDAAIGHLEWMLLRQKMDAREEFLLPKARRDEARQQGTKKERRPEITKWITAQLQAAPDAKSPDLWKAAPEWLTEQISYDRFSKRVTAARKSQSVASK